MPERGQHAPPHFPVLLPRRLDLQASGRPLGRGQQRCIVVGAVLWGGSPPSWPKCQSISRWCLWSQVEDWMRPGCGQRRPCSRHPADTRGSSCRPRLAPSPAPSSTSP